MSFLNNQCETAERKACFDKPEHKTIIDELNHQLTNDGPSIILVLFRYYNDSFEERPSYSEIQKSSVLHYYENIIGIYKHTDDNDDKFTLTDSYSNIGKIDHSLTAGGNKKINEFTTAKNQNYYFDRIDKNDFYMFKINKKNINIQLKISDAPPLELTKEPDEDNVIHFNSNGDLKIKYDTFTTFINYETNFFILNNTTFELCNGTCKNASAPNAHYRYEEINQNVAFKNYIDTDIVSKEIKSLAKPIIVSMAIDTIISKSKQATASEQPHIVPPVQTAERKSIISRMPNFGSFSLFSKNKAQPPPPQTPPLVAAAPAKQSSYTNTISTGGKRSRRRNKSSSKKSRRRR
jgi:hypothetical protein